MKRIILSTKPYRYTTQSQQQLDQYLNQHIGISSLKLMKKQEITINKSYIFNKGDSLPIKIILLGDCQVEKILLMQNYGKIPDYQKYKTGKIKWSNCNIVYSMFSTLLELQICKDQSQFGQIKVQNISFQNANANSVIICFSSQNQKTFESIFNKWIPYAKQKYPKAKITIAKMNLQYQHPPQETKISILKNLSQTNQNIKQQSFKRGFSYQECVCTEIPDCKKLIQKSIDKSIQAIVFPIMFPNYEFIKAIVNGTQIVQKFKKKKQTLPLTQNPSSISDQFKKVRQNQKQKQKSVKKKGKQNQRKQIFPDLQV